MFGPFRVTNPLSGGLLWKIPWRMSKFQKRRHRLRLRAVDNVVATVDAALAKNGQTVEALERWKAEMPTEAEMLPRDKYTVFDRNAKRYRKSVHSMSPSPTQFRVVLCVCCEEFGMLIASCVQRFPSGQGCRRESTLPDTKDGRLGDGRGYFADRFGSYAFYGLGKERGICCWTIYNNYTCTTLV